MTEERLGDLFEAFAKYYWSISISFVIDKITEWHPEVTAEQIKRVLHRCNEHFFWHHCCVLTEGLEEPELVVEHLFAVDEEDLDRFIAARMDIPYYDCDEATLLTFEAKQMEIPEARAVYDFGKSEWGLEDDWARQLVQDCVFQQPLAFCDRKSWVMGVLDMEQYGKIHFRTVDQVERFRELGNKLYQVLPNPVFRGWKPKEIDNPPALLDDIPERDEDIPDRRPEMDKVFAPYGGREKASELLAQSLMEYAKKKKVGSNDPCPCGSGKKYKKCCGR